jgi:hypothetical protein
MNTVGKVLVVLNLVFALATGGLMAYDFVVRTNWKTYAEDCQRRLEVASANAAAMKKTFEELDRQAKNALRDLDAEKQNRKNDEIVRKIEMDDARLNGVDAASKYKETELSAQKLHAEINRLKEESAGLVKVIEDRTKLLMTKERENRELRLQAVADREKAESTIARNEHLLEQLAEARRKLGELESSSAAFASVTSADPNRPNPPSAPVHGTVEKIDQKDGLVEISVGAEQGLKKYHTLEVFRLRPEGQYLGRIRIVEVFQKKAIGRLVRTPLTAARPLQQGDQVASSLGQP